MHVKGLTRKQLITWLESTIRNDQTCITEGDMCRLFDNFGDTYKANCHDGELSFKLITENDYWNRLRPFLPRRGDTMKGIDL